MPAELHELLAPFPDEVQEIALRLRQRVLAIAPAANEVVWDAVNAVSCVYTPTDRWQDGVVHVATYSKHVNLGFNQGASLPDPRGVLAGTGSRIRHVTFTTVAAIDDADWIDDYLAAAGLSPTMGERRTTIRVMEGKKRRPG